MTTRSTAPRAAGLFGAYGAQAEKLSQASSPSPQSFLPDQTFLLTQSDGCRVAVAADAVTRDSEGGALFASCGTLDNRSDIARLLGEPAAGISDHRLILLAFRRWGEDCPIHLMGDWAMAVWVEQTRRLFLAIGDGSSTAFYFTSSDHGFLFGSQLDSVLRLLPSKSRLNDSYIAQFLIGRPLPGAETAYADVARLCGFQRLTWTPGNAPQSGRYWSFEDIETVRRSREECAEGLRDVLSSAIRARIRRYSRVGVSLSSGLDSAAVAVFAANELSKEGRRLYAYTGVPAYNTRSTTLPGRISDEGPLASLIARKYDNIEHRLVACSACSPIASLRRATLIRQLPVRNVGNHVWSLAILDEAQAAGVELLLTGQAGNMTVSWSGRANLRQRLLDPPLATLPRRAVERAAHWLRGLPVLSAVAALGRVPINESFAREITLEAAEASSRRGIPRAELLWFNLTSGQAVAAQWVRGFGIAIADPTADRQVIEFAWSIPAEYWGSLIPRWPLREALKGLLADAVRLRRLRAQQSADITFRLLAHARDVEEMLDEVATSSLARRCVDLALCRDAWKAIQSVQSPTTTQLAETVLLRGLAAAHFLAEFERTA